jgi:hypothetical protein
MNPGTMKLLVAIQQMVDATAPEENNHRIPIVSGHQLQDLLRAATVLVAPAEAAVALVPATPAAEAAAAGAPHMVLAGELVAAAIAGAEATQTATSPASHAAAMMPAAELKKYVARRPLRQATATVFLPSPLNFATCFSQINLNLWGSPSMTRRKTQFNGLGSMPYQLKTLVATTTRSASTSPSS